jgi:hypothetical protein
MKLSSIVCASVVSLAVVAANGVFAHVNNTTTRSNTQHNITDQNAPCPTGETAVTNAATGKQSCVTSSSKNISDGAAKGQATESTFTPVGGGTHQTGRRILKEDDKMSCQASGGAWQCQDSSQTGTWTKCLCFMQDNGMVKANSK